MREMDKEKLFQVIDGFSAVRILVVGDLMLDRFIWGKVSRISPEAPVPVVCVTKESSNLGGSANVVTNIETLGGTAVPVGLIGFDEAARALLKLLRERGVSQEGVVRSRQFRTIQKTRIIAHHQQVVRVDHEVDQPLDSRHRGQIEARALALAAGTRAVIVSDYGKGVITPSLLEKLANTADRSLLSIDPKDPNFEHYRNAHVMTPNQAEAERMSGTVIRDEAGLRRAAEVIFHKSRCRNLLITRGEQGMALFQSPESLTLIPTRAREVYDVSGAGDTVIATYTLALAAGATPHQAAVLANAAAGVVVGKLGTASVSGDELKRALEP